MSELEKNQEAPEALQEGQADGADREESGAAEHPLPDLDQDPRFRKHKSLMDQRLAQERAERERLQKELEEHRRKVEELSLRGATPTEQAKYYQNRLTALEEEQRVQAQRQEQQARAYKRATELLDSLGLTPETPGLDWEGDPLTDGFERLALSAAKMASSKGKQTQERVEAEVRKAKQDAIKETGAAQVSTAKGDAGSALEAEYRKEMAALRGSSDMRAYVDLRERYREKGLPI